MVVVTRVRNDYYHGNDNNDDNEGVVSYENYEKENRNKKIFLMLMADNDNDNDSQNGNDEDYRDDFNGLY
jgi:hypothetical protein